ncbi:MAG: AsmA family protein, partial [Alphaproteobacteria bacterium]|nr:AsmA family protein [Alphaproteobacteria bacterium]
MTLKQKILVLARMVFLFFSALVVAIVVALAQLDTNALRNNLLDVLRSSTGMPIEIDGEVSWKLSLRPVVRVKSIKIPSASWAKNKYIFEADSVSVRLNLISLFGTKPVVQNVRIHDAKFNLEKNAKGVYSWPEITKVEKKPNTPETDVYNEDNKQKEYLFMDPGLGGVQIRNLVAKIDGKKYKLDDFNIRAKTRSDNHEYTGWLKVDKDVLPFVISLDKYNPERKVYPVRLAFSSGGKALTANVALERTSKMPIDFVVKGDIPDFTPVNKLFKLNLPKLPAMTVNISGGFGNEKLTLHRSSVSVLGSSIFASGTLNWSKKQQSVNLKLSSKKINLLKMFPGLYQKKAKQKNKKLRVFKDIPLYG